MNRQTLIFAVVIVQLLILSVGPNSAEARTDVYSGSMNSTVEINRVMVFQVPSGVDSLQIKGIPIYPSGSLSGFSQNVDLSIIYDPEPTSKTDYTDEFGNQYQRAEWISPSAGTIAIKIQATAVLNADLSSAFRKTAPFPMNSGSLTSSETQFLQSTSEVQSNDSSIVSLANSLVSGCSTEYQAVDNIINWVAEEVSYDISALFHTDAVWVLQNKKAVCAGYAQLSLALLRAAGIPARFIHGYVLGDSFTIPYDGSTWTKRWGEGEGGEHAWIEVYYPSIGWVAYDPQDSKTFVDTRHIKFRVGSDRESGEGVNWTWSYPGWSYVDVDKTMDNFDCTIKSDTISVNRLYSIPSPDTEWLWARETSPTSNPAPPPQVTLELPTINASINDSTPAFGWLNVIYPSDVTYRLEIDNDSDFLSPRISENALTTNAFTLATADALSDNAWHWRVQAVNDAGVEGDWSSGWSFIIDTIPPDIPSHILPRNGAFIEDNTPWFIWLPAAGADNYEFQCATDNEFMVDFMHTENISRSSHEASVSLPGGTYYWHVRAGDKAGNLSDWSPPHRFTILPSLKWYLQGEDYSWIYVYGDIPELDADNNVIVTGEVHLDEDGRPYILASVTEPTLPTTTLANILSNPESYENSTVRVQGTFAGTTEKMPVAGYVLSVEGLLVMLKLCAVGLIPVAIVVGVYQAVKPKHTPSGRCDSCGKHVPALHKMEDAWLCYVISKYSLYQIFR